MSITADYNFVPLSAFVWQPSWGHAVSHDQPFQDGWCGEIEVILTARSQLLVGGGDDARSTEGGHTRVRFCRVPGPGGVETLAIPGSSLRGMLRAVTEIASFGRMALVDDRRLGVRDLTKKITFYTKRMNRSTQGGGFSPTSRAGWLSMDANGEMRIQPCRFARVEHGLLTAYFAACRPDGEAATLPFWGRAADAQSFRQRYAAIEGCTAVSFVAPAQRQRDPVSKALRRDVQRIGRRGALQGGRDGFLVVTGGVPSKKREFVFFDESVGKPRAVPAEVVRAFEDVYDHGSQRAEHVDGAWMVWKERWRRGLCGPAAHQADPGREPGIPVFYQTDDQNRVIAFGPAMMFKLPYDQTVGEVVANTAPEHRNPDGDYDMAELLFGALRPTPDRCLRGRVSVGMARPVGAEPRMKDEGPYVLGSPKPNYYPNYISQPAPGTNYATYMKPEQAGAPMPEIRGWKRYHARSMDRPPPAEAQASEVTRAGRAMGSALETVPMGTRFATTLRLHNLRPAEIGALLWVLRFGDRALLSAGPGTHRHALGMGRPRGFGQATLHLHALRLRPNDPGAESIDWRNGAAGQRAVERLLEACLDAFEGAVSAAYAEALPAGPGWARSEQIAALQSLANPGRAPRGARMVLDVPGRANPFAAAKTAGEALPLAAPGAPREADFAPRARATDKGTTRFAVPPENDQA